MADTIISTISKEVFDYIVVGGGTAGLCLASRLSENPNIKVLVLEAGSNELANPNLVIPAMWIQLLGTSLDWHFSTVPQEDLGGRKVSLSQGKVLGGSSALNAQSLVAPSKKGIDAWEKLGNKGWNWSTLAPYFRKFHSLHLPDEETRKAYGLDKWLEEQHHGTDGPVQVELAASPDDPMIKAWYQAFENMGYPISGDPWSGSATGGYSNFCVREPASKTRSYSATAYYAPVADRTNLTLVTEAAVQKILFEGDSPTSKATGVRVKLADTLTDVKVSKEVILTSGTINSPKLLELSGIGSKSLLTRCGIDTIIENENVGENLQDHLSTGVGFEVVEGVPTLDALVRQEPATVQKALSDYQTTQSGPFATGAGPCTAYMPVTDFISETGKAEQEALFDKYAGSQFSRDTAQFEVLRDIVTDSTESTAQLFIFPVQSDVHHYNPETGDRAPKRLEGNYISIGVAQNHPFSRGCTHIASGNPEETPTIDPRYFSHPLDQEIMARHVKNIEAIADVEPIKSLLKPNGRRNHPSSYMHADVELAKDYCRNGAFSIWHPVGTCAMLPREKGGVVDTELRVYGTQNVRVADASIMPIITRSNTMTAVYAVAERAADIISGRV